MLFQKPIQHMSRFCIEIQEGQHSRVRPSELKQSRFLRSNYANAGVKTSRITSDHDQWTSGYDNNTRDSGNSDRKTKRVVTRQVSQKHAASLPRMNTAMRDPSSIGDRNMKLRYAVIRNNATLPIKPLRSRNPVVKHN